VNGERQEQEHVIPIRLPWQRAQPPSAGISELRWDIKGVCVYFRDFLMDLYLELAFS